MKQKVEHYQYAVLEEAASILASIDMPAHLRNPRCVMTLAACAGLSKQGDWKHTSENYKGTHEIIEFINKHFPNKASLDTQGYQENSRETFRDETLKKWISAGIMEDKPGLSTNSKDNAYRFTSQFAALLRSYGTKSWDDALKEYRKTHTSYADILKQAKELQRGYEINFDDYEINLKQTAHNKLQIEVLKTFVPNFTEEAVLLYIADAKERKGKGNEKLRKELGIDIFDKSTLMPDIVLYDKPRKRILFIEAYNSTGEFTVDRVNSIKALCHCPPGTEVAFITAFWDLKTALRVFSKIAWDTDIWIVEDETHMIHKNGDRFLGRPL
ncbi:MAG: type II restriction endonuclease [Oscillospiraceae bacterium]|nr:type II restriction endonuclease [Oscillospiraceae bacterium]